MTKKNNTELTLEIMKLQLGVIELRANFDAAMAPYFDEAKKKLGPNLSTANGVLGKPLDQMEFAQSYCRQQLQALDELLPKNLQLGVITSPKVCLDRMNFQTGRVR